MSGHVHYEPVIFEGVDLYDTKPVYQSLPDDQICRRCELVRWKTDIETRPCDDFWRGYKESGASIIIPPHLKYTMGQRGEIKDTAVKKSISATRVSVKVHLQKEVNQLESKPLSWAQKKSSPRVLRTCHM